MARQAAIQVEGLRALSKKLRATGNKELPKAFRAAGKRAVEEVIDDVRANVPKRSGRLAASLRPAGQANGATLREGNASAPYAGPVEFGGWPRGRPFIAKGRYIFPTVEKHRAAIVRRFEHEVNQIVDRV